MTYKKNNKEGYGLYLLWAQVAGGINLFAVGMIVSHVNISIRGTVQSGYYISSPVAAIAIGLSLVAFPWVKYEYLQHKVITWSEVKRFLVDKQDIVVLFITYHSGWVLRSSSNGSIGISTIFPPTHQCWH